MIASTLRRHVSANAQPKMLAPTHPNAGIEAEFQRRLERFIAEMHNSTVYWIRATYRAKPPEMAMDAEDGEDGEHWTAGMSPARALQMMIKRLAKRWIERINALADDMAKWFAKSIHERVDASLQGALKKGGFAVEWKMSAEANDVMQATIGEQVGLIKSIPQRYFSEVEGMVMRSVARGGDLATLSKELGPLIDLSRIGKGRKPGESDKSLATRTRNRARMIARDQNAKATATMARQRQLSLGMVNARWQHSGGGRYPRQEHMKWSKDRAEYKIAEGMYSEVDKEKVWPGTPINCRCLARPILPGFVDQD